MAIFFPPVVCTSESFAHRTDFCLHNTGTRVNTTDFMACQKACELNRGCQFWTFKPHEAIRQRKRERKRKRRKRRRKKKKRRRRVRRSANRQQKKRRRRRKRRGSAGGICIMKTELALCGRRRAKMKGVVSGPKACTPK